LMSQIRHHNINRASCTHCNPCVHVLRMISSWQRLSVRWPGRSTTTCLHRS